MLVKKISFQFTEVKPRFGNNLKQENLAAQSFSRTNAQIAFNNSHSFLPVCMKAYILKRTFFIRNIMIQV